MQILRSYQKQRCDEVISDLMCRNNALEYEIRLLESVLRNTTTQCSSQDCRSGGLGTSTISFEASVVYGDACELVPLSTEYMEQPLGLSGRVVASNFQSQCFPVFGEKLGGRSALIDGRLLLYPPAG